MNERNVVEGVCSQSKYTVGSKRSLVNGKIFSQWGKISKKSYGVSFRYMGESDALTLRGIELFTTHKEQCHRLCESQEGITCSKVDALTSNHEEADTRMLCHAFQASTNYPSVTIKSPDTDVFFIALNASSVIPSNMYFETGNQNNMRIISINKVRLHYGPQWCSAFVGLHSFTGTSLKRMPFVIIYFLNNI